MTHYHYTRDVSVQDSFKSVQIDNCISVKIWRIFEISRHLCKFSKCHINKRMSAPSVCRTKSSADIAKLEKFEYWAILSINQAGGTAWHMLKYHGKLLKGKYNKLFTNYLHVFDINNVYNMWSPTGFLWNGKKSDSFLYYTWVTIQ